MNIYIIFKADKKDKDQTYAHNRINEQVNKNEEERKNLHGKPGTVAAILNFNSKIESDASHKEETCHLSKHHNFDDIMASFEKATVQFLPKFIFIQKY